MAKQNLRKLIKFSNYSYCITLPKDFVARLGWKKGDLLQIKTSPSKNKLFVVHDEKIQTIAHAPKKIINRNKENEVILAENSEANLRW